MKFLIIIVLLFAVGCSESRGRDDMALALTTMEAIASSQNDTSRQIQGIRENLCRLLARFEVTPAVGTCANPKK